MSVAGREPIWEPPLRLPRGAEWTKPLTAYLKENFSEAEATAHKDVIADLQSGSKEHKAWKEKDMSVGKIATDLLPYAKRVTLVAKRFANLKCSFKWRETTVSTDAVFTSCYVEALSPVFLAGILYMRAASEEDLSETDGIKSAYRLFLTAAGVFQFLSCECDEIWARVHDEKERGVDLSADVLQFYLTLCVSEAVRCSYLKALKETATSSKHSLLAKLSGEAMAKFTDAAEKYRAIQQKHTTASPQLLGYLYFGSNLYAARSCFHMAEDAQSSEEIGLQVSLLNQAVERCSTSHTTFTEGNAYTAAYSHVLNTLREKASKENRMIYSQLVSQERVPIPTLGKEFVKPTPFEEGKTHVTEVQEEHTVSSSGEVTGKSFNDLVPAAITETVQCWRDEVDHMIQRTVGQVKASHQNAVDGGEMDRLLGSYDPAAASRLPDTLVAGLAAVHRESKTSQGGGSCKVFLAAAADQTVQKAGEASDLIKRCTAAMDDDYAEEKALREKYGTALPVSTALLAELEGIRTALQELGAKVTQHRHTAEAVANTLPTSAELLSRLDVTTEEVHQALGQYEGGDANPRLTELVGEVAALREQLSELRTLQQVCD